MSHPLRIEYEGARYHLMNRGRARQMIFPDDEWHRGFLQTLGDACQRFFLEVDAYFLMPKHYHLIVRTLAGNVSRPMRHVDHENGVRSCSATTGGYDKEYGKGGGG